MREGSRIASAVRPALAPSGVDVFPERIAKCARMAQVSDTPCGKASSEHQAEASGVEFHWPRRDAEHQQTADGSDVLRSALTVRAGEMRAVTLGTSLSQAWTSNGQAHG